MKKVVGFPCFCSPSPFCGEVSAVAASASLGWHAILDYARPVTQDAKSESKHIQLSLFFPSFFSPLFRAFLTSFFLPLTSSC